MYPPVGAEVQVEQGPGQGQVVWQAALQLVTCGTAAELGRLHSVLVPWEGGWLRAPDSWMARSVLSADQTVELSVSEPDRFEEAG